MQRDRLAASLRGDPYLATFSLACTLAMHWPWLSKLNALKPPFLPSSSLDTSTLCASFWLSMSMLPATNVHHL
jgi:hypothetical protein